MRTKSKSTISLTLNGFLGAILLISMPLALAPSYIMYIGELTQGYASKQDVWAFVMLLEIGLALLGYVLFSIGRETTTVTLPINEK